MVLSVENLGHGYSAQTCHGVGVAHLGERGHSRLHEVVGVGRALGLRKNVLYAHGLEHGAHRTAGLHAGTGSRRLHEHAGAAELGLLLMGNRGVDDGNLDEILLCVLNALGDSGGYLIGLAETIADNSLLVADYNDRGETEMTASLGHLGDSLDGNQSVLELKVRSLYSFYVCICHSVLSLRIRGRLHGQRLPNS